MSSASQSSLNLFFQEMEFASLFGNEITEGLCQEGKSPQCASKQCCFLLTSVPKALNQAIGEDTSDKLKRHSSR